MVLQEAVYDIEGHLIVTLSRWKRNLRDVWIRYIPPKDPGTGWDVTYRLSKWDPNNKKKYLGNESDWVNMQNKMREMFIKNGVHLQRLKESAFTDRKLDIQAKNVYGKEDTMITLQLILFWLSVLTCTM